jgi:hypothetical protein
VGELVLQVLDCAVEHCHVVAGHVDHLETVGEVVQQEQLRVQVLHSRSHDYVGEDRQHLVRVQHPLLLLQTVVVVKGLDLAGNALRTGCNGLHLVYWRAGLDQLVEVVLAALEGVVGLRVLVDYLNVLNDVLAAFYAHLAQVGPEGALIKAELVFDGEAFWASSPQEVEYSAKFLLLGAEVG